MKIGLVPTGNTQQIRALESRPIDSLWAGGHVASRNPSPEAMMGLARLAALTERVTIGTSILLLPLYPPALIAKQVADLDGATGGRLILGVGVGGEYPQEFRALQVPVEERGRRTNEMIPLLRRLWTAQEISHQGRYYAFEEVKIHPAPIQAEGPPIVVAGRKGPAMRRAATLGDGWFPYLYSPRRYADSVDIVTKLAADANRDLTGFHWCVWIFLNINPDGTAAREEAAGAMGGNYRQDFAVMIDKVAAAGTEAEVTAKLKAFYDAGARHFIINVAAGADAQQKIFDRFFDAVAPALRDHAAASTSAVPN